MIISTYFLNLEKEETMVSIALDKEAEKKLEVNRIFYLFVCFTFWTLSLALVRVLPQIFGGLKSLLLITTMATVCQIMAWKGTTGLNRNEYKGIVFAPPIFFAILFAFSKGFVIPNIPTTSLLVCFLLIVNSFAALISKHSLLQKKEELLKESCWK